ncbi:MAG: 7-carboxy-7-deazaguanine synthase QueE [Bacteroidales bacterium]|nr:7-carboxy-7-deazaguanine synthase QueE [Bacteroidales bacterium]
MEEFYSLQGEGHHTGKAAYFIRLGGCDNGCWWCDVKESWNATLYPLVEIDKVIARTAQFPAKAVVITGGEPLYYNLDYLCKGLRDKGVKIFLETSGSEPLSGRCDWICLSPKKTSPPLPEIYKLANELKVIIADHSDLEWAEDNAPKVGKSCILYLQPEWSARETIIPVVVDYIKRNPKWAISLQSHKYIRIP